MKFNIVSWTWLVLLAGATGTNAISLLNGRYETSTDVQDYLNLASDAAAMKESDVVATKQDIYQNGLSGSSVTLQSLSLDAETIMAESPMYNIFRHAFLVLGNVNEGETEGNFDGSPVARYGDTLVNDLFELGLDDIETEAAVVVNVWMAAVHYLFEAMSECEANAKANALAALDKAVALWVGEGQVAGSNDEGHLLYNLAEKAGERFDQDDGEAEVNTELMDRFLNLQTEIEAGVCSTETGYSNMRTVVKATIGLMTVPLVQNFIHHSMNLANEVTTTGSAFVELYALATIPRVAVCDPAAYNDELHLDVLRELPQNQAAAAIASIQEAYHCLDITCSQVGSYLDGTVPTCTDASQVTATGYTTSREDASEVYKLDRDVKEIDVFLRFGAVDVAKDWYTFGWNAQGYNLHSLALDAVVPSGATDSYIQKFQDYYGADTFADNLISDMLEGVSPYNAATQQQLRYLVAGVLSYVVVFMTSTTSLQYALSQCASSPTNALTYWDTGALLYIGSMEGATANGDEFSGVLMYSTAKDLCTDFGTCTSDASNSAASNVAVLSGLKQGADLIEAGSCDALGVVLNDDILPAVLVPLVQGTLKYASYNADLSAGTTDNGISIGDTFARGLVPIVNSVSSSSATTVLQQMQFTLTSQPVSAGFSGVVSALRSAFTAGLSTSCSDVGLYLDDSSANMCGSDSSPTGSSPTAAPVSSPTGSSPTSSDSLAFGRYTFQYLTQATNDAKFSLDIRDMYQASSVDDANDVYVYGNNDLEDLTGAVGTSTLAELSTDATELFIDDLMFNLFRYALYDDEDLEDESGVDFAYADDVVDKALNTAKDKKLAAEASTVLNVWMALVHQLYEATNICYENEDPVKLIDSAVGLWIGMEQAEGKFDQGYMMYAIGQSAAQFYGLPEAESVINTELMTRFNDAQTIGEDCVDDESEDTYLDLYYTVNELIRTLTKPLILHLLYHMAVVDKDWVELYAVSITPQAYACSEELGDRFEAVMFHQYNSSSLTDTVKDDLVAFLRCQRVTSDDLVYGSSADTALKNLLDTLSAGLDAFSDFTRPIVGYTPTNDVAEIARIDADVREIYVLMMTQAYDAASDVYWYGHHSYDSSSDLRYLPIVTLINEEQDRGDATFDVFKTYFDDGIYANGVIEAAFDNSGAYTEASRGQLAEFTLRVMQGMVTYLSVIYRATLSLKFCHSGSTPNSLRRWNSAVALFAGSLEGPLAGGRDGVGMYSLANEVCSTFGACEASGEATLNEELLNDFTAGKEALLNSQCAAVNRTITDNIVPRLTAILIQGTSHFAILNEESGVRDPDTLGSAHALAKSVVPYVNSVNTTSAQTLEDTLGDFTSISTSVSSQAVMRAFSYVLRGLDIGCDDLGSSSTYSFCQSSGSGTDDEGNVADEAPVADTPTDLGDGLYVTTTYVQDRANIAQDVESMVKAVSSNNFDLAKSIYSNGENSEVYDDDGKFVSLRTLKALSTEETDDMLDEPLFNTFLYALQDDNGKFLSVNAQYYADTVVQAAFDQASSGTSSLPVEATLVLNLWMHIAHLLYESVQLCQSQQLTDEDGIHSTDIAVAYWIGDGQEAGSGENGHLLYALTERMGELFNMDEGGQSRTNTNILKKFSEAKTEISLPGACSGSTSSFLRLARIVNKIISLMTVPLIQGLIHYLRSNDSDLVQLYARAVVPMTAGCSPSAYAYLKTKLLDMTYNVAEVEDIITKIRSVLPCLGLSCSDIGVHNDEVTDTGLQCVDEEVYGTLAGYKPASDVRQYARLDLDMRQLEILLTMKAYEAAENLYTYGKNVKDSSGESMSIYHLATTSERSIVPDFEVFSRYYDGVYTDPSAFADEIIRDALDTSNSAYTDAQRGVVVLKTAQTMVMYFAALQALFDAVSECQSTSSSRSAGSSDLWDQGAAMLIGSLEGSTSNGTQYGYMYYDLAQDYCVEFGTCSDDAALVTVNEELISLLYSGKGAVLSSNCKGLKKVANEISSLMLVPIIQGALLAATRLSEGTVDNESLRRAEGYVYATATLPLVRDAKKSAATTIETYLGLTAPSSPRKTASEVFAAYADVYPSIGVDCELLGIVSGNDPCTGVVYKNGPNILWIIVGIVGGCLVCVCLAMVGRRKKNATLPENNPKFVATESGELNHSMDLLEKAFSSNPRNGHERSTETAPLAADMHFDASPGEDEDFEEAKALKSDMDMARADII